VVAVDRALPERLPSGVQFVTADLNADGLLPGAGSFDYILLADVIEHLVHPERLLAWVRGHLTPHGRVIISVPNVAHVYVRLRLLLGNFDPEPRGILDSTHMHFYTRRSFMRLLDQSHFRVSRLDVTALPLELVVPKALQGRVFCHIDSASAFAARVWPNLCGYQFVCEAEPVR
jgi:SAM-dependent methyltransferase